jgi:hypothetical protein
MFRLRAIAIVAAAALIPAAVAIGAAIRGDTASSGLRKSTTSTPEATMVGASYPIALSEFSAGAQGLLAQVDATGSITLVADRGDTVFYRIEGATGAPCYAVGGQGVPRNIEQIGCRDPRLASTSSLVDMSIYAGSETSRASRLVHLKGFAGESVTSIELRLADGSTVARVPVVDDAYDLADVPVGVDEIVAVDAAGSAIESRRVSP